MTDISPRQPMPDPRVARVENRGQIISALKGDPLSLSLLIICLALLGLFYYVLSEIPKGRQETLELTKFVMQQMTQCVPQRLPPPP